MTCRVSVFFGVALCVLVAGKMEAQDRWVNLSDSEPKVFVDTASVQELNFVKGQWTYRGWVKVVWSKARLFADGDLRASSDMSLLEVDCVNRQARVHTYVAHDDKGKVVYSNDEIDRWTFVIPESIGEVRLLSVCVVGAMKKRVDKFPKPTK